MDHPPAVIEKAQRLEELLQRVEQGEALAEVCGELDLEISSERLAILQRRYEAGERSWTVLIDGRYGREQKVTAEIEGWLYERKGQEKGLRGPQLAEGVEQRFGVKLSVGHINTLLRSVGLSGPAGRPAGSKSEQAEKSDQGEEGGEVSEEVVANAGLFFLEGAKGAMGIVEGVNECVEASRQLYQTLNEGDWMRVLSSSPETIWSKLDHLLYLPLLNLSRPRDLYYYQGEGLQSLYGFTYKYLPLEHFLGQMTRLELGRPLANSLADCYSQAWYPGAEGLVIFSDWHVKPHWTKSVAHSGPVTMWGRVMPGTKQLLVNGPQGRLLIGWNYQIDAHFSGVLVEMEAELAAILKRPIAYTIIDSEGSGLPLAQRYAQAERFYLTVLPRHLDYPLKAFHRQGEWLAVADDPDHEVVEATWADAKKAAGEYRRLILMRPVGGSDPTRIYAGRLPSDFPIAHIPPRFRQRWQHQELRIREMINGANLNDNFGYRYDWVPHRTRQRQWQEAQEQVSVSQHQLSKHRQALTNLRPQLAALRTTYQQKRAALLQEIQSQRLILAQRQQAGQPIVRCQQGLVRRERQLQTLAPPYCKRRRTLLARLRHHRRQVRRLQQVLVTREAARDAIDTETLCRQRQLEKDQLMLNLQLLLTNLHDWASQHYFAAEWQTLQLETATRLIYQKSGRVRWLDDRLEVLLEPYRYPDQQRAMETTCRRFNAANLRWRDGRLLRIYVAQET
jgi:hypothetical protein